MTAELARNAGCRTASRSEARRVVCLTVTRAAAGGQVYKTERRSLFPLLRNSPLRPNVPFTVSMFHSPAHQSAFLTQVTGKLRVGG